MLLEKASPDVTKKLELFLKVDVEKHGEVKKVLSVESKDANIAFVVDYLDELLPKIVHHRNLLKNYRTVFPEVLQSFETLEIHVDFSENLVLNLPEEIHSMYYGCAKRVITVHSGLVHQDGEKQYHPHLSDDLAHDQTFVFCSLREILRSAHLYAGMTVIITSDNCCSQYKSAKNFTDLQALADEFNIKIIRIYGVAGHGKNEVDTVGGTAKIALRTAIWRRITFYNAGEATSYLQDKFANSTDPSYDIKMIQRYNLVEEREKCKYIRYPTVKGSSCFNVLVFHPNSPTVKVAPHLCACEVCLGEEYGSCDLFESVSLQTGVLNIISLRSAVLANAPNDDEDDDLDCGRIDSVIAAGSICAIAADKRFGLADMVWFILVEDRGESTSEDCVDSSGHVIPPGTPFVKCYYLEKQTDNSKGTVYKKGKKLVFISATSIVHPLVMMQEKYKDKEDLFFLDNASYVEVLRYVQHTSLAAIQF